MMRKLLLCIFLFPLNMFAQEPKVANIKRYSIVYIFTNNNRYNEVYFDHKNKIYQTNTYSSNKNKSISSRVETTSIYLDNQPKISTQKSQKKISCAAKWTRTREYRFNTLKNNNLSLPNSTNKFTYDKGTKTVKKGIWYDHYTDSYFSDPNKIEIDHVVSIKEAACEKDSIWTREEQREFMNSTLFSALQPIYSNENNKKSSSDSYTPPNKNFIPIFKDMVKQVRTNYEL